MKHIALEYSQKQRADHIPISRSKDHGHNGGGSYCLRFP